MTGLRQRGRVNEQFPGGGIELSPQATGNYLLDVFREPHDGDTWICRHDQTIRLPYRQVIHRTPAGVPYLAPELVLLFKAKHARPKDQADFHATTP